MSALTAPPPFYVMTARQSQHIDKATTNAFGIDSFTLMEIAGYSAVRHLTAILEKGSHGIYLCGKGNNAGDALVIARYLVQRGIGATLVFLSGTRDLSADTDKNLNLLKKVEENDPDAAKISIAYEWSEFDSSQTADFIIDGMLGTGLDSDLRDDYIKAVQWSNQSELPVYAIDIPTGLNADTGKIMGTVVRARHTFSFGALKQGFYLNDGHACTGTVIYCELPFPNYLEKDCSTFLLDESWIFQEKREPSRHKYEAGVLYIIAGSEGLTGAAMLAAQSAWAEGIGAVILVCPHGILSVFENNLPQIIKKPVGMRDDYYFKEAHVDQVLQIIQEKKGSAILGPGIGREQDTIQFTQRFLNQYVGNVLVDADGLWCMAQNRNWNKPDKAEWILTPHPGELSVLFNDSFTDDAYRLEQVKKLAQQKKITLLSKGFPVILGTLQKEAYITAYDTRKFSRAGFGDVLAGKTGAYWAMQNSAEKSCALALFNGKKRIDALVHEQSEIIAEPKDLI